jgi:hypothetical protein
MRFGFMRARMALVVAALVAAAPAMAGNFDFRAAPQKNLNRIYRVDKFTGEMGACEYALTPGKTEIAADALGVTLCYPAGEGAGKQAPSEFTLIASSHDDEQGVFRVDLRTGVMSICFVYDEKVVCTAPK